MNVQKVTHEVRLQKWRQIVTDCRSSGKKIKTWCVENNVNIKTYYHWQKLVCQETYRGLAINAKLSPETVSSGPAFAELSVSEHQKVSCHHPP